MSENVKRALWTLLVCLLVGAAGFSAGRFSAPLQVDERTEYRTEYRTKVVHDVVTVVEKAKGQIIVRDRIITLAGEVREHEVVRTVEVEREHVADRATLDTEGGTATATQKTITLRPDWRVSLAAGASLVAPLVPIAGPLVIQACGSRRIVGGVSADLCLSTVGTATLGVSMEF